MRAIWLLAAVIDMVTQTRSLRDEVSSLRHQTLSSSPSLHALVAAMQIVHQRNEESLQAIERTLTQYGYVGPLRSITPTPPSVIAINPSANTKVTLPTVIPASANGINYISYICLYARTDPYVVKYVSQ
jgi:hypothetical protein